MVGEVVPIVTASLRGPSNGGFCRRGWAQWCRSRSTIASFFALLRLDRNDASFFRVSRSLAVPVVFIASGAAFTISQSCALASSGSAALARGDIAMGAEEIRQMELPFAGAAGVGVLADYGRRRTGHVVLLRACRRRRGPDAIMECLTRHGIRGAMADYRLRVTRLTFCRVGL